MFGHEGAGGSVTPGCTDDCVTVQGDSGGPLVVRDTGR
jgi:hypothetical protein